MAGLSLRDQLLKAGLADEKRAKQIAKEKREEAQQKKSAGKHAAHAADEAKRQALQAQAARNAERDREINRQQQEKQQRKALRAQVRQLVETNRIERREGEVGYRFSDGERIEKIYVTAELQQQLARGQLAIVRTGRRYDLVPAEVAGRIRERDPDGTGVVVVALATPAAKPAEDDPYAQFQVPDDLMW